MVCHLNFDGSLRNIESSGHNDLDRVHPLGSRVDLEVEILNYTC